MFSLLFIDSVISKVCCVLASLLDVLTLTKQVGNSKLFCNFQFLSAFLPCYLGACLTILVASIRYLLATKSKQNQKISDTRVSIIAFVVFGCLAALFLIYLAVNTILNTPFSFIVETCANNKSSNNTSRHLSTLNVLALQVPNVFSIISLAVDLCLVRFLRKSIVPLKVNNNLSVVTTSGHATSGELILIILINIWKDSLDCSFPSIPYGKNQHL